MLFEQGGKGRLIPGAQSLYQTDFIGDVRRGSTKQVASAVGEGAAEAISIREFLKRM